MKLRLRIGRQRAKTVGNDEVRDGGGDAADRAREEGSVRAAALANVPPPSTPDRGVVRVGAFCRVGEVGQAAVTETGRAVVAIRSGRCGRWVYAEQA